MGVVTFDSTAFLARYPEFSTVATSTLQLYFDEATFYLNNTDKSLVSDVAQRTVLLNMITAHIAALNGSGVNGNGASGMVGRITSASEGSVSVSVDYVAPTNGTQAYFQQTPYGAAYWAASGRFRSMRYIGRQ